MDDNLFENLIKFYEFLNARNRNESFQRTDDKFYDVYIKNKIPQNEKFIDIINQFELLTLGSIRREPDDNDFDKSPCVKIEDKYIKFHWGLPQLILYYLAHIFIEDINKILANRKELIKDKVIYDETVFIFYNDIDVSKLLTGISDIEKFNSILTIFCIYKKNGSDLKYEFDKLEYTLKNYKKNYDFKEFELF